MIEIYTGTVGSGKSYHAIVEGLRYIERRRHVIANFPIKSKKTVFFKRFEKAIKERWIYMEEITVDKLIEMSISKGWYGKESQCLLVFDEAGTVFNARDWNVKPSERKEWIKFFSQSRKLGYDVIMIAQDMRMIDRQIRSLSEYEVKHKDLRKYLWFRYLPIRCFAAVYHWSGGKFRGSVRFIVFRKSIANRYDTFRLFNYAQDFLHEKNLS